MLKQIIIGSIMVVVGYIIVWKSDWFLRNFGAVSFAEKHLSTEGGSRLFYKLLGLILIIIGGLTIAGLIEGTVLGILRFIGFPL